MFACLAVASAQTVRHSGGMVPSGKGFGVAGTATEAPLRYTVNQGNGINWHGGSVMPNTVNIYTIWYGKWNGGTSHSSDSQQTVNLVKGFITGVSGSGYEMINSTYGDNTNNVTGLVNLAGSVNLLQEPLGTNLSDSNISTIVSKMISKGKLPNDANGVYFVLTSSDVTETGGFCTIYCGWHNHATLNGTDIKYSFVGNPDRCSSACEAQTVSPNGDSGADGMISIVAHEMEESISDPDLNAWWQSSSGGENADLCAWKWGLLTGTVGSGAYNETINGVNYLIQMNWENSRGGGCDNFLGGTFYTK
jgi:hypothetical protein